MQPYICKVKVTLYSFLEGKKEEEEDTNVVVDKTMECQSASIHQVID